MMNNDLNGIQVCEVCGGKELESVLNLGMHPMCDDLVPVGSDRECREYPIEILYCQVCRTAHQRFQVPKHDLFPSSYHYRSRFTADVLQGMQSLVTSCVNNFGALSSKKVLDIGCNDGSLLDFFQKEGAVSIGIEPTGAYTDAEGKGHSIFNDYLSVDVAKKVVDLHGKPDFITFTNVFAHIENLNEVLESLKILIGDNTTIVIENHYLGSVLDGNQFDTFYHEHPRTYSYTSFVYMAQKLGCELLGLEFPSRYGGNIRVFLGNAELLGGGDDAVDLDALNDREERFLGMFSELSKNIDCWRSVKKTLLDNYVSKYGALRAKAFPGRAAILVKLLALDETMISEVYEKPGSMKIGHYLPGTKIPICSDNDLLALPDKSQPILNLAWHISVEIKKYLSGNNYSGEIINILSPEDFSSSTSRE